LLADFLVFSASYFAKVQPAKFIKAYSSIAWQSSSGHGFHNNKVKACRSSTSLYHLSSVKSAWLDLVHDGICPELLLYLI